MTKATELVRSLTAARKAIGNIDKLITATHRELLARESVDQMSAKSWHRAWRRQHQLWTREAMLFSRRGRLQLIRDDLAYEAARRAERKAQRAYRARKPKKCPKCGHHTLYAA